MPSNGQPSFPFYLLVASPFPFACVALVGTVASALGKSVAFYTKFGSAIVLLVCITGVLALVGEVYALPVAINALARHQALRTYRNLVALGLGAAFLFSSLAYLVFGLRHG